MVGIQRIDCIEGRTLTPRAHTPGTQVGDGIIKVTDECSLVRRGKKACSPKRCALRRLRRAENHKSREVCIDGPKAIRCPGAQTRPAKCLLAGVHLEARAIMINVVG